MAVLHPCFTDGREINPDEAQISSLNPDTAVDLGLICPALGDFWPLFEDFFFICGV
jgi:hypothetical protein